MHAKYQPLVQVLFQTNLLLFYFLARYLFGRKSATAADMNTQSALEAFSITDLYMSSAVSVSMISTPKISGALSASVVMQITFAPLKQLH